MSKLITVFGATGNQGGSVIRYILSDAQLSKEFSIRAITRDPSKPAAKALAEKGVEVISADLMSPEKAVAGAHTVFLVTNFWETMSTEKEMAQGKSVADASKAAGVKHIIFSSLINVTKASQGRFVHVQHFDGKAEIEDYIRSTGVPATFFQPGMFMSGFFGMFKKQDNGSYRWAHPVKPGGAKLPLFDVQDTGKYVKIALKKFPELVGTHIRAAHHYYTSTEIVDQWKEVTGKELEYVEIPPEVAKQYLPPAAADDLLEMMLLMGDVGYYGGAEIGETDGLEEPATTWKDFVKANKEKW